MPKRKTPKIRRPSDDHPTAVRWPSVGRLNGNSDRFLETKPEFVDLKAERTHETTNERTKKAKERTNERR